MLTGNPIRKELKKIDKKIALDFFGLNRNKFTLLVMGGSLGSHSINLGILKAASEISSRHRLQMIHLAGLGEYDLANRGYKNINIDIKLFGFLKDMRYAYNACDLVICRAGATTIAEIIFFALPAIIIPYPFAYQHQLSNAKFLEDNGCAVIIADDKLDNCLLSETIEGLINNPQEIKTMRYNYNRISQLSAVDALFKEVISLNN